ncbi:MAG: cold shock domain-containing protein [Rickettsiales bacterium]|jgi:cold shock CspA family protein|nr:cold shock domain-containing protein [Rickettsiales bacterium]
MRQGKVKWYNGKKCFGFVAPDTPNESGNTDDVFVHSSSLKDADIRFLNEGDVIKFDEEVRNGKLSATKIELVSRDEESAKRFQERRSSFRSEHGDRRGGGYGDRRGGDRRGSRDEDHEKSGWAFWKK